MANIQDIKILRGKTGAGFADCKKALEESNNDIDAAIKVLKEMGMAMAEKRSGRATGEGSVFIKTLDNKAVLLELLCETDFVARNEEFQKLGNDLCTIVLEQNLTEKNAEMQEMSQTLIGTIKENMEIKTIRVIEKTDSEIFARYTHGLPARLGAIVVMQSSADDSSKKESVEKFAFNCTLHAVAKLPVFLNPESITESYKTEQMEIITKQVKALEKPPQVEEGIIKGKWNKHTTEICFTLQAWVHDEKSTVEKEIHTLSKQLGIDISINNFIAFSLGAE